MEVRTLYPRVEPKPINDYRKFTKPKLQKMIETAILVSINGIAQFKYIHENPKKCFSIEDLSRVRDVETDTPIEFQKQFFLLMDIISGAEEYARLYVHNEHPDVEPLMKMLFKLYFFE